MQTRCPSCGTDYSVDANALVAADCFARCHRCGIVFDVLGEHAVTPQVSAEPLRLDERAEAQSQAQPPTDGIEPRFEVPSDLEPLQPSPDAALDVTETLSDQRSPHRIVYGTLALLLSVALGVQLAWQYRVTLLDRFPQLQPLCDRLECVATQVHEPERLRILQREMRPAPNQPGTLSLSARFRNEAEAPQPLPDIQLSLLDNNGTVLIRRSLSPRDYLYPPPPTDRLIAPGEVVTINIDFKDPGYAATGFIIDFL